MRDSNNLLNEVGRRAAAETSYVAPAAGEAVGSAVGSAVGTLTAKSFARHAPVMAAGFFTAACGIGAVFAFRVVRGAFGTTAASVAAGGLVTSAGLVIASVIKTGNWRTAITEPEPMEESMLYPLNEPAPPKGME